MLRGQTHGQSAGGWRRDDHSYARPRSGRTPRSLWRSPLSWPARFPGDPVELGLPDIEGRSGRICFAADLDAFREAFPGAVPLVGAHRLRGLAALSRLVGMECPGLHSIFASIHVELTHQDDREINYHVKSVDARFNMVDVAIEGAALRGRVQAFLRPSPTRQLSAGAVAELVADGAYSGHHALIVGGSRGLGELTAKRSRWRVAPWRSPTPSGSLRQRRWPRRSMRLGSAAMLRYDAGSPAAPQLEDVAGVTHVYYFATPRIAVGRDEFFDATAFDAYARIYVTGFHDLVTALNKHCAGCLRASSRRPCLSTKVRESSVTTWRPRRLARPCAPISQSTRAG